MVTEEPPFFPPHRRVRDEAPGSGPKGALLVLPAFVVMLSLFLLPLAWLLARSVTSREQGTAWYSNYVGFFRSPVYPSILLRTIETALVVTAVCLLIGYPFAYLMGAASKRGRGLLLAAILLPLWSSVLVRTWGWTVLLADKGVINRILLSLGLVHSPLTLMRNTLGVAIGMTQVLLPIMVLPLYATMRQINPDYISAAGGLGASPVRAFRRVFVPLTRSGIVIGSLLVFVLSLGFFITPALLGSPANGMLSEQIVMMLGPARDPGLASAAGGVLLVATILILSVVGRRLRFAESLGILRA